MALSDIEIRAEIAAERLVFEPPITADDRIGSSSEDLLLHKEIIALNPSDLSGVSVNPADPGFNVMKFLRDNGNTVIIPKNGSHKMPQSQFTIARTLEVVKLPLHLAARIEGRSSLARLGLSIHFTAPSVHAGFHGPLYLEMNNVGPVPIELSRGMKIAQLILEHVGLPAMEVHSGQFHGQK